MAKGGSFENEVCRLLSRWVSQDERDDIFTRSDASGARFTARRKSGKDTAYQSGDITFSDPLGEPLIRIWSIETKTGYGGKKKIKDAKGNLVKKIDERWDVLDAIDSQQKETVLQRMWEQCKRDASAVCKEPVLIFRRNRRSPCIAIKEDYYRSLVDIYGYPPMKMNMGSVSLSFTVNEIKTSLVVMALKDFFSWIPEPTFCELSCK